MVDGPSIPCYVAEVSQAAEPMYKTYLVNFGFSKYEGPCLQAARAAAEAAGFESVISLHQEPILAWSPIGGWKKILG